jgi:hypothetical protein
MIDCMAYQMELFRKNSSLSQWRHRLGDCRLTIEDVLTFRSAKQDDVMKDRLISHPAFCDSKGVHGLY